MPDNALCERVLRVLDERFSRVEVLDRDLRIDSDHSADFAAIDGDGRLLLGVVAEHGGEALWLAALGALIFARENISALAVHWRARRLREDLEPAVVAVALSFDDRALARLRALDPAAVRCFELRTIESRRGRSEVLAPVHALARSSAAVERESAAASTLAEHVARRLERIDVEVARASDGEVTAWRWHGQELCTLVARGAALTAAIPGNTRSFEIKSEIDCGAFLDGVVQRYLALAPEAVESPSSAVARELAAVDPVMTLTPQGLTAMRAQG